MREKTNLDRLIEARDRLYEVRGRMRQSCSMTEAGTPLFGELLDIWNVLDAVHEQMGRTIRREWNKNRKSLNLRQAEEFALKAKIAKAGDAVASVLKEREDDPSHK